MDLLELADQLPHPVAIAALVGDPRREPDRRGPPVDAAAGRLREQPLGVCPRLVVRTDQPGGPGGCGEQVGVVGRLGERGDREPQGLVRGADLEVVRDALTGELDHLVVAARAGGVPCEIGEVGARRRAQDVECLLVEPTAFPAEQLALDRVAHQLVAEAELVVVLLDEQAALDERAELDDQLVLGAAAQRGQHVEAAPVRRAPRRPRRCVARRRTTRRAGG